jgi:hypothetical protein
MKLNGGGDVPINEETRLGVVKFYGPARNKKNHLWGFVTTNLGLNPSEDVSIAEPNVQGPINDGMLVLITVERNGSRLFGKNVSGWLANEENGRLLLREVDRYIAQNRSLPKILESALEKIPSDLLTIAYRSFLSDEAIAQNIVSSPETLTDVLKQCIATNRSIKWLSRIKLDQKISLPSTRELIRHLDENGINLDLESATWLLQNSELSQITTVKELRSISESIASAYVTSLPLKELVEVLPELSDDTLNVVLRKHDGSQLVTSPEYRQLWKFYPDEKIKSLIRDSSNTEFNFAELCKICGTQEVLTAWRQWFGIASQEQRGQLRLFLLHEMRDLMNELSAVDRLRLSCWGISRGHSFDQYSIEVSTAVRQLTSLDGSHDVAAARRIQAKILLSLPKETVRAMAVQGDLFGEYEHLHLDATSGGAIHEDSTCDGSKDPMGHAFGHLAVLAVSKKEMREADRSKIMASLIHEWEHDNQNEIEADEVVSALQSWIINLAKDGQLISSIGELTRILPSCRENIVQFCEAKPPTGTFKTPYCPRLNEGCSSGIVAPQDSKHSIENWSLIDLLGVSGSGPREGLSGKTLINSVAGWGNIIYEISERMKCESCQEPLLANLEYSKKFNAAYAITRAYCSAKCGEHEVYFSHCFNCKEVIDSRESRFVKLDDGTIHDTGGDPNKKESGEFFMCIHCANGGMPWCPSCGEHNPRNDGEIFVANRGCRNCGHQVSSFPRQSRNRITVALQPPPFAPIDNEDLEVHPSWKTSPRISQALKLFTAKSGSRNWGVYGEESPF